MRKCFRQIQATRLPGWFLKNQQVPLSRASFPLKNNSETTEKGFPDYREGKRHFMALRDGGMKCTFPKVIKGERDQLEARNLSFQTTSAICKWGTGWWQWGLLTKTQHTWSFSSLGHLREDAAGAHQYFQGDQKMMKEVNQTSQELQLTSQEAKWGAGKRIGPGRRDLVAVPTLCSPALQPWASHFTSRVSSSPARTGKYGSCPSNTLWFLGKLPLPAFLFGF